MFLLNLSFAEFLLLFGAVSGLAVALYLLDRSRRRQVVPTLRFWNPADQPASMKHRRRIQQPWSLLLQLLGMALLLLALAQLRFGSPEGAAPEHVLLLDTSSWMGAHSRQLPKGRTLMDEARRLAHSYIDALPGSDRVIIVRADALSTPATGMESDRHVLGEAIDRSAAGATALNLGQALDFAAQYQRLHAHRSGEIVFIGAGRVSSTDSAPPASVPGLRVIPVPAPVENVGLRRIGLHRSPEQPGAWDVFVSVRNHGVAPHTVPLFLKFGGAIVGSRQIAVPAGSEQEVNFTFRTRAAGWLEAQLMVDDDLAEDDRAILEIPRQQTLKVAVFTSRPDLLRPLFSSNPRVEAQFYSPAAYSPSVDAQIVVLDGVRPPQRPARQAIWIDPPNGAAPIPVRTTLRKATLTHWRTDHPLGAGLHARDILLDTTDVFEAAPNDIPIAEVEAGPVILARPGSPRQVVLGFHPMRSALRYELATPILFANILRWMAPDIFSSWELNAAPVGSVNVLLDRGVTAESVRVTAEKGNAPLPFSLRGQSLNFFSGEPGSVKVAAGDREIVYSLTLPEVAETAWRPPPTAARGVPPKRLAGAASRDVWPWLAAIGALLLAVEWVLYGRGRARFASSRAATLLPRLLRRAS
jgi:hypothetical protein